MAQRAWFPANSYGNGRVYAEAEFVSNSTITSSTPVTTFYGSDAIVSVTRTGTGVYTVTLRDPFYRVVYKNVSLDNVSGALVATLGNVANENTASPITMTLRVFAADRTTATDLVASTRVGIQLALKNSTVGP